MAWRRSKIRFGGAIRLEVECVVNHIASSVEICIFPTVFDVRLGFRS